MRWVGSLFLWFVLSGGAGLAQAEEPKRAQSQASELFKEAEALYESHAFREALEEYKAAYRITKDPELLLHIGQCYQQLQRYEAAADTYQRYLSFVPESLLQPELEALRIKLEQQASDARRAALPADNTEEDAAEALSERPTEPKKIPNFKLSLPTERPALELPTKRAGTSLKPLYTSALTLGALGLFVGGLALREAKVSRDLQEEGASIEEIEASLNRARAMAHGSSALLGTALVLRRVGRRISISEAPQSNKAALTLTASPTSATLSLTF